MDNLTEILQEQHNLLKQLCGVLKTQQEMIDNLGERSVAIEKSVNSIIEILKHVFGKEKND